MMNKAEVIQALKDNNIPIVKGEMFAFRVSPEDAAKLINRYKWDINIMCKEYGDDDDWNEVNFDDLENCEDGVLDSDWKTLEIWPDIDRQKGGAQ